MAFNNSTVTSVIILLYRIRFIFRNKTRLFLKMDSDGSKFLAMNPARKLVMSIYLACSAIFYNRIIVESSCGYSAFKNIPVLG
jgi:hypothetical protein